MNLSTEFLKMHDTLINRKVFLARFLATKTNIYLWDFLSNHQLKEMIKPGNCSQSLNSLNTQTLINSKAHWGQLVQVMLSVPYQACSQTARGTNQGFYLGSLHSPGNSASRKPHKASLPWLQCLAHGSCWNNMHKLLKQLFWAVPPLEQPQRLQLPLHNPRALPQLPFWRRKLPCNLFGNVVHICQQGQDALAPDRCICKPSDSNPKVIHLWKRESIHLVL